MSKHNLFNLDLSPKALTYDPNLAKVKGNLHTEYQGQTIQLWEQIQRDGRTDWCYQVHYLRVSLSYAVFTIIFAFLCSRFEFTYSNILPLTPI